MYTTWPRCKTGGLHSTVFFVAACEEAGFVRARLNALDAEELVIPLNTYEGIRWSTSLGYVDPGPAIG